MSKYLNPFDYIEYAKKDRQKVKPQPVPIPPEGAISYTFGTTDHRCYILELDQREGVNQRLEIQFMPKNGIQAVRDAKLSEINVIGRNNPFQHYSGGNEVFQLGLNFFSDDEYHNDVKRRIDWLRSLTMNNGDGSPLPKVKVVFGRLFRWEVFTISRVAYNMTHLDGEYDFMPLQATCDITLKVDTDVDVKLSNLRY